MNLQENIQKIKQMMGLLTEDEVTDFLRQIQELEKE